MHNSRLTSARVALVLTLSGLVLAACGPTPAPAPTPAPKRQPVASACRRAVPSTPATYQKAFDKLRTTYTEWATADGSVPVTLPDGRTLWLYGDTFVGKVASSGLMKEPRILVSNSGVLQSGRCFTPLMGGAPGARTAWIAPPGPGEAYWPASAVVDAAGRLQVFLMHVRYSPLTVFDLRVATFSLPSLALQRITPLPFTSATRPYGTTAFADAGYAYLYSAHDQEQRLARVSLGSVTSPGAYEFWTGGGWSTNPGAAGVLSFTGVPTPVVGIPLVAPIGGLSVTRRGSGFLGTVKLVNQFSDDVSLFGAPGPQGPWTYLGRAATTPAGIFTYGAMTVFGLQGTAGAPVLIFSTNVPGMPTTITQYGPRFVNAANVPASISGATVAAPPTTAATAPSTTLPLPPSSTSTTSTSTTSTSTTSSTTTTSTTTTSTTTRPGP